MKTLQYERGAEAGAAGGLSFIRIALEDMIESLQGIKRGGEPVLNDPVVRDELMQLVIEDKALSVGDKRSAISALTHDYRGSLPLSNKYRWTEHARRMRQAAVRLQGAHGSLYVKDEQAVGGGFWQRAYLQSFSATIGGGTSQVQANIIAEHVLGLPK
jgi:alkylation response protein AidB-like acyl-CoA dehydrogenase